MRRNLITAILALVLVPLTVATILRLIPEPPPTEIAYPRPMYRVAVALMGAMRDELTAVTWNQRNASFGGDVRFRSANGRYPAIDEIELGENDPAFWITFSGAGAPSLMRLNYFEIEGTTRDGRPVRASVYGDPFGKGSVVDFHGDPGSARLLSGRIAHRLAHPAHKHGTPEDRADLDAFFNQPPPPKAKVVGKLDPAVDRATVEPGIDPEDGPR